MTGATEIGQQYYGPRYFRWTMDAAGNYVGRPRREFLEARYPARAARVLSRLRFTVRRSPHSPDYWLADAEGRDYYGAETREGAAYKAFVTVARSTYRLRQLPYAYANGTLSWPDETWQERAARRKAENMEAAA